MVAVSTRGKPGLQWHACSCTSTPLGQYQQRPKVAEASRRGLALADLTTLLLIAVIECLLCPLCRPNYPAPVYYMSQFGPRLDSSTMLDFSPCLAFYHRPPLAKAPISVNGHSSKPPLGFASKFACFVSRRRPHYSVCNGNGPIPAWVSSPTHFHHRKPQDDLECSSYYQKSFQPDLP